MVEVCDELEVPAFFAWSSGDSCVSESALSGFNSLAGLPSGLDTGDATCAGTVGVEKAEVEP